MKKGLKDTVSHVLHVIYNLNYNWISTRQIKWTFLSFPESDTCKPSVYLMINSFVVQVYVKGSCTHAVSTAWAMLGLIHAGQV
jgi:hypothetical protein